MLGLIGEVFLNVAEIAVCAKRGVQHLFHDAHINNAKDACEDCINKYINQDEWHDDYGLISSIAPQYYNSCSSEDKEIILKNLQTKIEKLDKEIQDIKDAKKTLKYPSFYHPTKEQLIKNAEEKKNKYKDVLTILNKTQTLGPTI